MGQVQNFPFFAQYLLLRRLQHRLWVVPHLHQKFFLTLTPVARKKEAVLLDFAWIGLRIFLCISDHIMLTKHKCYRRHQYFKGGGGKAVSKQAVHVHDLEYTRIYRI